MTTALDNLMNELESPMIDSQLIADLEILLEVRKVTYEKMLQEGRADRHTCGLMYKSIEDAIHMLKCQPHRLERSFVILLLKSQIERYQLAQNTERITLLEKTIKILSSWQQ